MTKQFRNTDKIVQLAKEKSEKTRGNVEKVISKMSLEGRMINFNTVSKETGVSKSWLYKELDIRKRIETHRELQQKSLKIGKRIKKSTRSDDSLVKTLKVRIKELEKENKVLKKQIEKLYGDKYFIT